jgi:hypothetical protein
MARLWNTPIFIIATVYFLVDGVFSYVTHPIAVWLGKRRLLERVRIWITSLRPYPSLALFAIPVIILEPAKPLSGYLIGTGHFFAGAVVFITAEVLKLTFVDRLFQLNKKKLLSIPAFGWGYRHWRKMMDVVESSEVWKAARRMVGKAGQMIGMLRQRSKEIKKILLASQARHRYLPRLPLQSTTADVRDGAPSRRL